MVSSSRIRQLYWAVLDEINVSRELPLIPNNRYVVEAQVILSKLPAGGAALDIGTGYGIVPLILHRSGFTVVSVEFPVTGGTEYLERLKSMGIEGHYTQVGADPLPLADGRFDVVFAGNVIEHLPHSPSQFLEDLRRVLKPGGHIVVDTKNAVDIKTRMKLLLGVSNWPSLMDIYGTKFNGHHHKEYTLRELVKALQLAGFDNVSGFAFDSFFHKASPRIAALKGKYARGERLSRAERSGIAVAHHEEYLRLALRCFSSISPSLRSDIIAVGRKGPGPQQ